jgi:TRAP-type C4-dicarboxylate transport system substrate-binding protein
MNLKKYQALSSDLRQAVDESFRAACARDRTAEVEKEESDLQVIKKAGVQVNEVKDLQAFQDRMGPVYDLVAAKVGKEYLNQFMSAVKAAK